MRLQAGQLAAECVSIFDTCFDRELKALHTVHGPPEVHVLTVRCSDLDDLVYVTTSYSNIAIDIP